MVSRVYHIRFFCRFFVVFHTVLISFYFRVFVEKRKTVCVLVVFAVRQ